jgi:hypothetical protein
VAAPEGGTVVAAGKKHAASTPPQAGEECGKSKADGGELEALSNEERYILVLSPESGKTQSAKVTLASPSSIRRCLVG